MQQASALQVEAGVALGNARSAVVRATANFGHFRTPQRNVSLLNDSSPFVLFPVRIETRFRAVNPNPQGLAAVAAQHELLVRIYPDDCSIDTFEPFLPNRN